MNNLTANTEYTVAVVAFNELGEGGNRTEKGKTRPEGLRNVVIIKLHVTCYRINSDFLYE